MNLIPCVTGEPRWQDVKKKEDIPPAELSGVDKDNNDTTRPFSCSCLCSFSCNCRALFSVKSMPAQYPFIFFPLYNNYRFLVPPPVVRTNMSSVCHCEQSTPGKDEGREVVERETNAPVPEQDVEVPVAHLLHRLDRLAPGEFPEALRTNRRVGPPAAWVPAARLQLQPVRVFETAEPGEMNAPVPEQDAEFPVAHRLHRLDHLTPGEVPEALRMNRRVGPPAAGVPAAHLQLQPVRTFEPAEPGGSEPLPDNTERVPTPFIPISPTDLPPPPPLPIDDQPRTEPIPVSFSSVCVNVNGLKYRSVNTIALFQDLQSDILAVTEAKLDFDADIPVIPQCSRWAQLRTAKGGGVVVWIRNHLRARRLDLGADSPLYEGVWLEVQHGPVKWAVAAVYLPPSTPELGDQMFADLHRRIYSCLEAGLPLLLLGDLNTHIGNDEEGVAAAPDPEVKGHGGSLRLLVAELEGRITNAQPECRGLFTRFPMGAQRGRPAILDYGVMFGKDITLEAMQIDDGCLLWADSDHAPIQVQCLVSPTVGCELRPPERRWVWKRKDADWVAYEAELLRLALLWGEANPRALAEMSVDDLYQVICTWRPGKI